MSKYQSFRSARRFEEKAKDVRDGYKKMLDEYNQQAPLYHFNESIKKINHMITNMESGSYDWKDEAADQLLKSLTTMESSLKEHRQTYMNCYQEGVENAEAARKGFAQEMMSLVNSFDKGDWIECALGEIKDDTDEGIAKVKQKISSLIRELAKL